MAFNHHHHTYHHHHHDDDEDAPNYPPPGSSPFQNPHQPPPPQPPFYGVPQQPSPPPPQPPFYGVPQPPPPQPPHETTVTEVFHTSHVAPSGHHGVGADHRYGYPSAPSARHEYTPPAGANASVHHVSHETVNTNVHHVSHESHHLPHHDSFSSSSSVGVHHVSHEGGSDKFSNKPTVKVVTKADPNYCLTVRDGKVILAYSDPSDEYQRWYKDLKYSTRVKDEEGCPAFSLVNKVTGEAIKHSIGATHPVRLIPYNPDYLDESVLWTESRDLGAGHRAIRMVNNIRLNVDAYHGDKRSGGVHDGTTIVLWEWNNGDNQHWKIVPN